MIKEADLNVLATEVEDRESLVNFLQSYVRQVNIGIEIIENNESIDYLCALIRCLKNADGRYENLGLTIDNISPWRLFAEHLLAAGIYE
jgi:hypothetical protein